jgi:hypothetical protein
MSKHTYLTLQSSLEVGLVDFQGAAAACLPSAVDWRAMETNQRYLTARSERQPSGIYTVWIESPKGYTHWARYQIACLFWRLSGCLFVSDLVRGQSLSPHPTASHGSRDAV